MAIRKRLNKKLVPTWLASICIDYKLYHIGTFKTEKDAINAYNKVRHEWFGLKNNCRNHGHTNTRTHKSWLSMRERCNNPNNTRYSRYGGRGIIYCKEWDNFERFLKDMGKRPPGTSLDRIDNDGNYTPENCRWATAQEQNLNKSVQSRNSLGVKGVLLSKSGSYQATIVRDKKSYSLGSYSSLDEAIVARYIAEDILYDGGFF